jgi:tRNA(fMet)-specific endonuclease VapC
MSSLGIPPLLDTDTLSEVLKLRDLSVARHAREYLDLYQRFHFSIITRFEILRGLLAKAAPRQIERFEIQCRASVVLPLSDAVVVRAAEHYAHLRGRGALISDADLLIAATAQVHGSDLVTENRDHFSRIPELRLHSWR